MSFEEGDTVIFRDKHSDHDGEEGEIESVIHTMFDEENYVVSFEDGGREAGVDAGSLEAPGDDTDDE